MAAGPSRAPDDPKDAEEILKEALQLSEGDHARIAGELLTSLGPVERRTGEEWIAEVERRAQAAIDGVPGLTWGETRRRVERTRTRPAQTAQSGSKSTEGR